MLPLLKSFGVKENMGTVWKRSLPIAVVLTPPKQAPHSLAAKFHPLLQLFSELAWESFPSFQFLIWNHHIHANTLLITSPATSVSRSSRPLWRNVRSS
jgi:hypothetical protein